MRLVPWLLRSATARSWASSALASTALLLPLLVLESWAGRRRSAAFPVALFVTLWLLALAALVATRAVRRHLAAEAADGRRHLAIAVAVGAALVLTGAWVAVLLDQLPCFLGVPNCD